MLEKTFRNTKPKSHKQSCGKKKIALRQKRKLTLDVHSVRSRHNITEKNTFGDT